MYFTLFSSTGFHTNQINLLSSTGFDTIEINLVFMHGILSVKVKVLQGYIARITEPKPSDYWQSTRSKVVKCYTDVWPVPKECYTDV